MTTAAQILGLLRARHSNDVFVPECKDGPTHTASHLRMDAWVMPRSWVHPWTTAYEIKVTRKDFLGDDKWPAYLDLCHRFYFATAPGVIHVDEIPQAAGLVEITKTGTRLRTRKKAPLREDVELPESLWRYIVMCRATIDSEKTSKVQEWTEWLATKDEKKRLGYNVSKKIRELVQERVDRQEARNIRLQAKLERLDAIARLCERLGVDPEGYRSVDEFQAKIARLANSELDPAMVNALDRLIEDLGRARERWGKLKEKLVEAESCPDSSPRSTS